MIRQVEGGTPVCKGYGFAEVRKKMIRREGGKPPHLKTFDVGRIACPTGSSTSVSKGKNQKEETKGRWNFITQTA